jgi:hypothetical protein
VLCAWVLSLTHLVWEGRKSQARSSRLSPRHPTFAGVSSSITAGFPTKVLMWLVEERLLMLEPGGGVAEASSLAWSAWESESPSGEGGKR